MDDTTRCYELKINEYELKLHYLRDLLSHPDLSGDHKIVLWTIREIILTLRVSPLEPTVIHLNEIARKTGLGYSSVRRIVNQLHQYELIVKTVRKYSENGQPRQEVSIALTGNAVYSPKLIETPARNHGGARPKCEKCGSENLEYTAYTCLDCGHHGHLH